MGNKTSTQRARANTQKPAIKKRGPKIRFKGKEYQEYDLRPRRRVTLVETSIPPVERTEVGIDCMEIVKTAHAAVYKNRLAERAKEESMVEASGRYLVAGAMHALANGEFYAELLTGIDSTVSWRHGKQSVFCTADGKGLLWCHQYSHNHDLPDELITGKWHTNNTRVKLRTYDHSMTDIWLVDFYSLRPPEYTSRPPAYNPDSE